MKKSSNEKNNLGLFAAMVAAFGGAFKVVSQDPRTKKEQHKYDERKARRFSWGFLRPADLTGYRQVHGTLYRRRPKLSKAESRAARSGFRSKIVTSGAAVNNMRHVNQVRAAYALLPRSAR